MDSNAVKRLIPPLRLSPSNPSDDYIRKLYYYKKAEVREYWIIDSRTEKVIVYYLEQSDFQMEARLPYAPIR